jgi:hypothetical protein
MNERWMRHFTKNISNSLIIPSPKTYHPTKEQYYYNSAHVVSSGKSYLNAMKAGKPKIKVVVGKARIQENTWIGKLYKEFLSILNWADL